MKQTETHNPWCADLFRRANHRVAWEIGPINTAESVQPSLAPSRAALVNSAAKLQVFTDQTLFQGKELKPLFQEKQQVCAVGSLLS